MTFIETRHRPPSRWPAVLLAVAMLAVATIGLALMVVVSPRVPYADQWGFYRLLIEEPFGRYLFMAENGHREVLPKLARMAELRWLDADQSLQIGVAIVFALATLGVLVHATARARLVPGTRLAILAIGVLGVFWTGNQRALAHPNDAIHAYLVTFFAFAGIALVLRASGRDETRRAVLAASCGLAATFSFGSGIAALPAMLLVLVLRRAPWAAWRPLLAGLAIAFALYLTGAAEATTTTLRFDPVAQLAIGLHWLAAPLVYVFWPLLDPAIAAQLPAGPARAVATTVADAWAGVFGPIDASRTPQIVVGAIGLAWFLAACLRAWRGREAEAPIARLALGIAGFAACVGAIIALSRATYFVLLPDQIQAPRYLVWSSLFWAGLLMAWLAHSRVPARAVGVALAVLLVVAPSEVWMGRLALAMRSAADQVAIGATVGVLAEDEPLGENLIEQVRALVPLLRERGEIMFAWPDAAALGTVPARVVEVVASDVRVEPVVNRFADEGARITLTVEDAPSTRLVVLDPDGRVQGLVMRGPLPGDDRYRGWVRGRPDIASWRVAMIE